MVGIQDKKKKGVVNSNKSDSVLVEELNQLNLRFDSQDSSDKLAKFWVAPEGSKIQIDEMNIWRTLEQTNVRKSHGPDSIISQLRLVFEWYFHIYFSTLFITE